MTSRKEQRNFNVAIYIPVKEINQIAEYFFEFLCELLENFFSHKQIRHRAKNLIKLMSDTDL